MKRRNLSHRSQKANWAIFVMRYGNIDGLVMQGPSKYWDEIKTVSSHIGWTFGGIGEA